MLVLIREKGEQIVIGDDLLVAVTEPGRGHVRMRVPALYDAGASQRGFPIAQKRWGAARAASRRTGLGRAFIVAINV
jgi:hypothetical protein